MSERASERDAVARFLRAMAATFDSHDTVGDREQEIANVIRSLATEITDEEHAEFRAERDGRFELIDGLVVARLADQRDEARAEAAWYRSALEHVADADWPISGPTPDDWVAEWLGSDDAERERMLSREETP